jgi:hypothetical protein
MARQRHFKQQIVWEIKLLPLHEGEVGNSEILKEDPPPTHKFLY